MQLPRYAQAFLARAPQRGLLAGAFSLQGALFGLTQIRLPVAVGEAGDHRAQEPAGQQRGPLDHLLSRRPGREVRHQEPPAAHGRRAAVSRAGRRVHGREDGQTGDGPRVGVQHVGRLGGRGHREDRPRRRLVEGEGRRREGHQHVVEGRRVRVEGGDGHDEGADHDR